MVKESEKGKGYMEGWELLNYISKSSHDGDETEVSDNDFKAGKKSVKARTSIKTEILFLRTSLAFSQTRNGARSNRAARWYSY